MKKSIYDAVENEIMKSDLSEDEKDVRMSKLKNAREQKINILLVGATGSGKSSTINSIFDTSVAKVGVGVAPETSEIECYELDNLTIWDTPGLGDSVEGDKEISERVASKLLETDEDGVPIIDIVLVVVDASSKDLGTTYELINNVLIPNLTPVGNSFFSRFFAGSTDRIIIALNQADMAMKGKHWDSENNCPDEVLKNFLEEKCQSMEERISDSTGVDFDIMYYCAGYTEDDGTQKPAYNLTKLLYKIVLSLPAQKRIAIAENLNDDEDMWKYDDEEEDYNEEIAKSFTETVWDNVSEFADKGIVFGGTVLGMPGAIVGAVACGAVGAVVGVFKAMLK